MGIKHMHGEYFSWLSHDDIYTPDKIEKSIAALRENPTHIVYSDYELIDEKGDFIASVSVKELHPNANYEFGLFPIIYGVVHGCSLLIPKSCFDESGLFDENLRATQDYDLWFKMFRGQKLIYIPKAMVKGRVHSKQITFTSEKTSQETEELWIKMLKALTHEEIYEMCSSDMEFWAGRVNYLKGSPLFGKSLDYAYERLEQCNHFKEKELSATKAGIYKERNTRVGFKGGMKKVLKKVLRPLYRAIHNRFTGVVLNEISIVDNRIDQLSLRLNHYSLQLDQLSLHVSQNSLHLNQLTRHLEILSQKLSNDSID
jgi:uncharacterized coiled-coil protein SlyX